MPDVARRRFVDPICDSGRWDAFRPRPGDIVVSTPPKSGTTWMQGILALLISGDPQVDANPSMKAPWIDMKMRPLDEVMARLEAQTGRRHVKSHSPFDCIPDWPQLRYIAVYRHPIDVHLSYRAHRANMRFDVGLAEVAQDPSESFRHFLQDRTEHHGLPVILDHYRSALARDGQESLARFHYADMLRDLGGAVARVAQHVGIDHPPEQLARLTEAARFDSMKANADRFTPSAGQGFWHDDRAFFDSARCNKWEGVLSAEDLAAYDAVMAAALEPDQRRWLEGGDSGLAGVG
ncbi:sulfotransferase domain-containing protein [Pseudoponticoccus marisrubri]|nr:sulfotransferase domain-containing protein [Pseudoponticoccus marisrubri]